MAEPSFPGSQHLADREDKEDEEEETKRQSKGRSNRYEELCPHKAFPSKFVNRNLLKTQKDYTNFLLKNPREGHPWHIPPEKIKMKPSGEERFKWLAQARKLKLRAKPIEESKEKEFDMSKYIIMERTNKKKKKKEQKISKTGYEIKVNKELEFLLDVMATSKEAMIQKAIDYERRREEEERKAKEEGDIKVLKNIVQGMMLKVMNEYEESLIQKPSKRKQKNDIKKRKKDDIEEKEKAVENGNLSEKKGHQFQSKKINAKTTIELVSFLKDLIENDKKKRDATFEDKSVSPYASEKLELPVLVEETEEKEEKIEHEESVEEEGEEGEKEWGKKDEEGVVDMEEVKKKLQAIKEDEEEEELAEEEQEETKQEKIDQEPTPISEESMKIVSKLSMSDKSAQFNYFEERKALFEKKPKNITDDLAHFLKAVMMADDDMREVMREKELLEFKKKQLDFMNMGMFLQKTEKSKKIKKGKNDRKDKKGKKVKSKMADISKDLSYSVRPNEFMLMLQVLMNLLGGMEEQEKLKDKTKELIKMLEQPSIGIISNASSSSRRSEDGEVYEETEEDNEEDEEEEVEEEDEEEEEEDDDDD